MLNIELSTLYTLQSSQEHYYFIFYKWENSSTEKLTTSPKGIQLEIPSSGIFSSATKLNSLSWTNSSMKPLWIWYLKSPAEDCECCPSWNIWANRKSRKPSLTLTEHISYCRHYDKHVTLIISFNYHNPIRKVLLSLEYPLNQWRSWGMEKRWPSSSGWQNRLELNSAWARGSPSC